MHVVQYIHRGPPAVGGAEAAAEALAAFLRARGDTVTLRTSTAIDLEAFRYAGKRERPADADHFRPLHFPARRWVLKACSLLPVRPWQCATLPCNPVCPGMWADAGRFAGPVDAVLAAAFPYSFPILCGLRLARRRRVPLLLTPYLHLGDLANPADPTRRQYLQPCLRWLLRQADRVFVMTDAERRAVEGAGVPPRKVVVQGLGILPADCTGGDRTAARAAWGVSNEFVVGHLANASVEKGTVDLLEAAGNLPGVKLVLAGPEMPNFRTAWERSPHRGNVSRLGVLTEPRKRDFFAGIDAFALPSRSDSFGLVLLEAWANGKPVIVYRAGGPGELVRDGLDGRVLPCGDVQGLRSALSQLAADRAFAERLGSAGRERVLREFGRDGCFEIVRREAVAAVAEFVEKGPAEKAERQGE